jgi:hypothetical protein
VKPSLKAMEWISEVKLAANSEMLRLLILLAVHTGEYPIYKPVCLFVCLFPPSFFVVLFISFSFIFLPFFLAFSPAIPYIFLFSFFVMFYYLVPPVEIPRLVTP